MVVIISWDHRSKSLRKLMVLRAGEQAWALWPLKHSLGAAEDRRLHRGLLHATCTCFSCATIAPPNLSLMMIVVMMITIWLTVTI